MDPIVIPLILSGLVVTGVALSRSPTTGQTPTPPTPGPAPVPPPGPIPQLPPGPAPTDPTVAQATALLEQFQRDPRSVDPAQLEQMAALIAQTHPEAAGVAVALTEAARLARLARGELPPTGGPNPNPNIPVGSAGSQLLQQYQRFIAEAQPLICVKPPCPEPRLTPDTLSAMRGLASQLRNLSVNAPEASKQEFLRAAVNLETRAAAVESYAAGRPQPGTFDPTICTPNASALPEGTANQVNFFLTSPMADPVAVRRLAGQIRACGAFFDTVAKLEARATQLEIARPQPAQMAGLIGHRGPVYPAPFCAPRSPGQRPPPPLQTQPMPPSVSLAAVQTQDGRAVRLRGAPSVYAQELATYANDTVATVTAKNILRTSEDPMQPTASVEWWSVRMPDGRSGFMRAFELRSILPSMPVVQSSGMPAYSAATSAAWARYNSL